MIPNEKQLAQMMLDSWKKEIDGAFKRLEEKGVKKKDLLAFLKTKGIEDEVTILEKVEKLLSDDDFLSKCKKALAPAEAK